jgi:DNA invertase Pin-like site-specific DNA recombinase
MNSDRIYRAAIYVRLSKEDGDSFSIGKNESDSITNQKLLIQNHLAKMPDIEVVATFEDDGFTGTNFERPGFQKLVEAIKQKTVDCVVVKDFSRLGREYLEAGNYIEKVFPALGVRFISINDDYDSLYPKGQTDSLIVPFKNLLNEQYSRDTSGKIRSALSVKRQQGLFVSSFAVFGYMRDPKDKNHLVVDEYAAGIVEDIYKLKMDGYSFGGIAKRLTERKVPTPADYKRECGSRYRSGFKVEVCSEWSAVAVKRILTNEVYCGHMIQGKRRKISYKVKAEEYLDKEQWQRIENTHEAIISPVLFNEVQRLLKEDTRVGGDDRIHPLAGKVYCADCNGNMIRKMVPYRGKKYFYYVCGNNAANSKLCSSHSINSDKLETAVLATLQAQIATILDMEKALDKIEHLGWEQREVKKLQSQLDALDAEVQQNQELRMSVYEDLKSGFIERAEYESLRQGFATNIENAKKAAAEVRGELNTILAGLNGQQEFLSMFKKYENIQKLERGIVVALVERVVVKDKNHVEVELRYADRFASINEFLNSHKDDQKKSRSRKKVAVCQE